VITRRRLSIVVDQVRRRQQDMLTTLYALPLQQIPLVIGELMSPLSGCQSPGAIPDLVTDAALRVPHLDLDLVLAMTPICRVLLLRLITAVLAAMRAIATLVRPPLGMAPAAGTIPHLALETLILGTEGLDLCIQLFTPRMSCCSPYL
jgi:hypothetical protein